jgi:gluconolactonase
MELRVWADGLDHPEGVSVDRHGVIHAGGEAGQLYRIDGDGSWRELAETGGFVLGLAFDADDRLYACDLGRKEVVRWDPATGLVARYSDGTSARPMRTPNFLSFAADGTLYVTDSGSWKGEDGCVYRVGADGTTEVWSTEAAAFPNGCCLSRTGDALYVVESNGPTLVRLPICEDGSAGPRQVVAIFDADVVPDGVAACADGSFVVGCYRPDALLHVAADGEVTRMASDPQGVLLAAPTNVVFAGEGLGELVVASLGRWHLTRGSLGVVGAPLQYPTVG